MNNLGCVSAREELDDSGGYSYESNWKTSVGDEVPIADLFLIAMIQSVYRLSMNFDEKRGYPTLGRIVRTCETIDTFRVDVPATTRQSMEPRSTRSRESSRITDTYG